jgi:hypothetical protein
MSTIREKFDALEVGGSFPVEPEDQYKVADFARFYDPAKSFKVQPVDVDGKRTFVCVRVS